MWGSEAGNQETRRRKKKSRQRKIRKEEGHHTHRNREVGGGPLLNTALNADINSLSNKLIMAWTSAAINHTSLKAFLAETIPHFQDV